MNNENLNSTLRERLNLLEKCWSTRDAATIVRELYTDTTEITGAGCDELLTGREVLEALVQSLVDGSISAKIRLDRAVAIGDRGAYSWVTWEVLPLEGPAAYMKSLFVWSVESDSWRIIADMYAEGQISA